MASEEGRAKNRFNRRTGERNRRYACNSEYHYAPQCSQKENRYGGAPPCSRYAKNPSNKPFSSIAMESPPEVRPSWKSGYERPERSQEQPFSTTLEIGGQFAVTQSDSVVALDTGAPANLVRFKWLGNRNSFLRKMGFQTVLPSSAMASFYLGVAK